MSCASGHLTVDEGLYRILIFKESTTFTPLFTGNVEVLVVGGGGGGGNNMGGGGGAGGYLANASYNVTSGTIMPVTVGDKGTGVIPVTTHSSVYGTNGGDSIFGTMTAIGGGAGGLSIASYSKQAGLPGGSGGGCSGYNNTNYPVGTILGGLGVVGQGHNGGAMGTRYYCGGGGGGYLCPD